MPVFLTANPRVASNRNYVDLSAFDPEANHIQTSST